MLCESTIPERSLIQKVKLLENYIQTGCLTQFYLKKNYKIYNTFVYKILFLIYE